MDFVKIRYKFKNGIKIYYPDFLVNPAWTDLMVRGCSFYAIWDERKGLWSTSEYDVARLVDREIRKAIDEDPAKDNCMGVYLEEFGSNAWSEWKRYSKSLPDKWNELDCNIVFNNTEITKESYCSRKLDYPLQNGKCPSYDELMSVLYSPSEREKIEWAIGSIIAGDSKVIQKFLVLYGSAGSGKSTLLNIVQKLFPGYYSVFEAKALGSANNSFALETFRNNPLIAIQHDGDLSHIEDNTKLNSIVSHERMVVNEKHKSQYELAFHSFLMMGTNTPVKITDAKSGILRRLIDVNPTGDKLPFDKYQELMGRIDFERSAIAKHCLDIYTERGKDYYDTYVPVSMLAATNDFFDFVEHYYKEYKTDDKVKLETAWVQYANYCDFANLKYTTTLRKFTEEMKNYWKTYDPETKTYSGFKSEKFSIILPELQTKEKNTWLIFEKQPSIFDTIGVDYPAQYANEAGYPYRKWENNTTTLKDIDTTKLHYVLMPLQHIVIDFDIHDSTGEKNLLMNLEAASKFPPTYAELSKSGKGIHLHYFYSGDVNELSAIYGNNIEIKVFKGNSSLRRQVTKCNNLPIATLDSGLPLKEVKQEVVDTTRVENEAELRRKIDANLHKKIHADTSSSVNYIYALLESAYKSGMSYDVSDMELAIFTFAAGSHNQSDRCKDLVTRMHFKSDDIKNEPGDISDEEVDGDNSKPIAFFDVEVFPNLFVVVYKPLDCKPVILINPTSDEVMYMVSNYRLIGFNNLKYDNHIIYARVMGYDNRKLYELSQNIINNGDPGFYESKKWSYTDIYDYSSAKQSLKKWEIVMGVHHHELGLEWDKDVPEELWNKVAEYCVDDVIATEALHKYLKPDFEARLILAELSGGTPNETTNTHTKKIIFGKEKNPGLVYTDLATGKMYDEYNQVIDEGHRYHKLLQAYWDKVNDSKPIINAFPGYVYATGDSLAKAGHKEFNLGDPKYYNFYRGEDVGRGGYVFARPGMYRNVALLDIASMHPHSALAMLLFGVYTKMYENLIDARIAIKHRDYDKVIEMLGDNLSKYVEDEDLARALSTALKIPINSVYGLTSASFKNAFKDDRNVNNIVALRGALFMVNLRHEVEDMGYCVAHIKTDSIKIPNADAKIIKFVMDYGKKYGYTFEHEATYERMCLVNNAVYIAKYADGKHAGEWTATGAEFAVPYVFKTLFSHEPIEFSDLCETRQVKSALYLDMNENLPEGEHDYKFVGRVGLFCPIKDGCGGGLLMRQSGEDKYAFATNCTGYRWLEAEEVKALGKEGDIDVRYYAKLVDDAIAHIGEFGNAQTFINGMDFEPTPWLDDDDLPF